MSLVRVIKKIKTYALFSFILPLIAINLSLLSYKFLGSYDVYKSIGWNKKKIELPFGKKLSDDVTHEELIMAWDRPDLYKDAKYSLVDCPKFRIKLYDRTKEGLIEHLDKNQSLLIKLRDEGKSFNEVLVQDNNINKRCVKNSKIYYFILSKNNSLEKLMTNTIANYPHGFSSIRNPYLYGEVSISRTARFFPNNLIFKPLIILSAFILFLYWKNNLSIFNNLNNKFSKKFFYFGALSCIFLALHAIFLGVEFDINIYEKIRRLIIIFFICFEVIAQIFLTRELYLNKDSLKNMISPLILKLKILFVFIVFFLTIISAIILVYFDPETSFKHMLEWNYFAFLLVFYFLSLMLWNSKALQKDLLSFK